MSIRIESVMEANLREVLELFAQYQEFYHVPADRTKNEQFLRRLLKSPDVGLQFLAYDGDDPIGFATLVFTESSLSASRVGTLNDLFVVPKARGRRAGRALMDHCIVHLRAKGLRTMAWLTHPDNHTTQRLYDSYPARREVWVEYTLPL